MNIKKHICLLGLNLFFFTNIIGAQKPRSSSYNEYALPIARHTRAINEYFLKASQLAKAHSPEAKHAIRTCCIHLKNLKEEVESFSALQASRLKYFFKTIKKNSSPHEKYIIAAVIMPTLSQSACTQMERNFIVSSLTKICHNLLRLNTLDHIDQTFCDQFDCIQTQYKSIFFDKLAPEKSDISTIITNQLGLIRSTTRKPLSTEQQTLHKAQVMLCKRTNQNTPKLKKIATSTFSIIACIAKLISWLPFRNTICAWLLKYDNKFVKALLIHIFGKETYKEIKTHPALLAIKETQKYVHIGSIGNSIHNFLQKPSTKIVIDHQDDQTKAQPYFEYANAMERLFFIEFLEYLQKSYTQSNALKAMKRKHGFFFSYKPKVKKNTTQIPEETNKGWADILMQKSIDTIVKCEQYLTSNSINTICNDMQEKAGRLVSSFFSFESVPQNHIVIPTGPKLRMEEPIIIDPTVNTLKDFLGIHFFRNRINPDYQLSPKFHTYDAAFNKMIQIHVLLMKKVEEQYQQQKDIYRKKSKYKNPHLPENWNDLPVKIDTLYQSLQKFYEERESIHFLDIFSATTNNGKIRRTRYQLYHHIRVYNAVKIALYENMKIHDHDGNSYGKIREKFLTTLSSKFSQRDNDYIFNIAKDIPALQYIFTPQEKMTLLQKEQEEVRRPLIQ